MKKNNIWILFEERPKVEVIEKILNIYLGKNKSKFVNKGLKIIPTIKNKKFNFLYKVANFKIDNIENIYLLLVSGKTSFVDFLLFKSKNKPNENEQLKNCLYGIEETKTDSTESRNTAAGQRGTKFLVLEYFSSVFNASVEKIMLYNNPETQNTLEAESVKFIKKCLKTNGVQFFGDFSDKYKIFQNIDEVIKEKNDMRQPPAGNVPVRIEQQQNYITISGILSKPKDEGNIGHDPNQGQLITISNTLRKLSWDKKIVITKHKVKQDYINRIRGNKFTYAMKILNLDLENIDTPEINLPTNYWYYETNGEKVGTILLHTICSYLKFTSIYENHAGSERGYFYSKNREEIVINKKYNGKNINLPDFVFIDDLKKKIFVCEGEMYKNYSNGIKQIESFDIFIKQYVNKYYPDYKTKKTLILSGGSSKKIKDNVLFQLNSDGKILCSNNILIKIKNFINENQN